MTAQQTVVYNDSDNSRLIYNDYYSLGSGSAERRVWVAPINPYVIQPGKSSSGGDEIFNVVTNSNNFTPGQVSNRIASKFQPYFTNLKTTDPKMLLMVYGPIKASTMDTVSSSSSGENGGGSGLITGVNGTSLSNLMLTSSLSNYSELMVPTSYAVTKFYEDYVAFRMQMETLSNNIQNIVQTLCCGGEGNNESKDPYQPIINESEMSYDTANEFLGRVDVLGPLVCSSGIYYRNYAFRFFLQDNTLVIPNAFVPFGDADSQLPVTTITDYGYRAPVSGYYHFDLALRLKILQVTTINTTALKVLLVRSVPGVMIFDPYQPPAGTNVVGSYMSPYMGTGVGYPVEDTCVVQCKTWLNSGDVVRVYAMGPTNRTIFSDSGNNNSLSMLAGTLLNR